MSFKKNNYVYVWKDKYGEPFYVGKGTGNRYIDCTNRCQAFVVKVSVEDGCYSTIVADNLSSTEALKKESEIITELIGSGCCLFNIDQNPNGQQNCNQYINRIKSILRDNEVKKRKTAIAESASHINHVIDDYITSERNRNIIRQKIIKGKSFVQLSKECNLSVRQLKNIVYDFTDAYFANNDDEEKIIKEKQSIESIIDDYNTNERNRKIIKDRFVNKRTFLQIAKDYHLSERQIKNITYKFRDYYNSILK